MKFNAYCYRHIKRDVTITYDYRPNPNHKRVLNVGPETITLTRKQKISQKDGRLRI